MQKNRDAKNFRFQKIATASVVAAAAAAAGSILL